MPLIRPKHIVSFSSEDAAQPAQNLLKSETYRKWRCAKDGEKQASVILELEKATQIHSVDIGNNGSALVEVLVGRSSQSSDEQYQVLLVMSSFMSPAESKSFTNTNRVRMFGPDKLSKPVATQKWDRIKLVCTQPFNKNIQYGLSFVNFHSPPEDVDDKSGDISPGASVTAPKRLGSFTLKDDSEEKKLSPGILFFKKLQKKPSPPPMSLAAEARATSVAFDISNEKKQPSSSSTGEEKSQTAVAIKRGNKAAEAASDRTSVQEKKRFKSEEKPPRQTSETSKRKHEDSVPTEETKSKPLTSKSSAPSSPPAKKKRESPNDEGTTVAFDEILKGVVFVLSGFVNPERASLRDKATQMGAQYKPDWGKGCTHLICAFANTPKFFQVKGKGKIVTKKWITDCFKKSKRLLTRNYHLPGDSSSSEESSEDEEAKSKRPPSIQKTKATVKQIGTGENAEDRTSTKESSDHKGKTSPDKKDPKDPTCTTSKTPEPDEDDIYGGSTDDELQPENKSKIHEIAKPPSPEASSSERDTEDELNRVQAEGDIFGGTTDDEHEEGTKQDKTEPNGSESSGPEELPTLPDFLANKHFLLYGEFDSATRRLLIRYITAYNGFVEEYMNDNVDFVITEENWDRNFDEALQENASLAFVRPKWILVCHEKGALVPFQPYVIVPS